MANIANFTSQKTKNRFPRFEEILCINFINKYNCSL